jgi:hypothetical protein
MTYFTPFLNRITKFATPANSQADYHIELNHSHRAGCTALNHKGQVIGCNNLENVSHGTPEILWKQFQYRLASFPSAVRGLDSQEQDTT